MDLVALFSTSFVVAFSGAAMPGPVLTATIAESTRRGPAAGPMIVAGHALLELVLVALVVIGLAPFLRDDRVFATIAIAGSFMLAVMTYQMARSIPSLTMTVHAGPSGGAGLMLMGALLSLSTPYWILWWATIGLGYILASMPLGFLGLGAFFTGHVLGDLVWYTAVSFAVGTGRRFLSDRGYRVLMGICAACMGALAVWFGLTGAQKLFMA